MLGHGAIDHQAVRSRAGRASMDGPLATAGRRRLEMNRSDERDAKSDSICQERPHQRRAARPLGVTWYPTLVPRTDPPSRRTPAGRSARTRYSHQDAPQHHGIAYGAASLPADGLHGPSTTASPEPGDSAAGGTAPCSAQHPGQRQLDLLRQALRGGLGASSERAEVAGRG